MGIGEDGRMIAALQTERLQALELQALEQIRAFARGNEAADFKAGERASAYGFMRRTLVQFGYYSLGKPGKGTVKAYLAKMTGFSGRN